VDWHLDTGGALTIARFLETRRLDPSEVDPMPLGVYLEYCAWFQREAGIAVTDASVTRLDRAGAGFRARLHTGEEIAADRVVVAIGFRDFAHVPADLTARLVPDRFEHTCTAVDLAGMAGQRCLIVGGRQSAFEWAALLSEAGAASIDLSYRHDTPRFAESHWAWAGELVERFVTEPGWYRRLEHAGRDALGQRFWAEGRLKLEPWLAPRIRRARLRPHTEVASTEARADGSLAVAFSSGDDLVADRVILATGYKPALARVPFLAGGNVLADIATANGCPALDDRMQSSVPNLFFTSLLATNDFGPFFAFTVSARASARLIGSALP
jgi:cation diffusion facilitator CzcD-associated flavoprotein CzcO